MFSGPASSIAAAEVTDHGEPGGEGEHVVAQLHARPEGQPIEEIAHALAPDPAPERDASRQMGQGAQPDESGERAACRPEHPRPQGEVGGGEAATGDRQHADRPGEGDDPDGVGQGRPERIAAGDAHEPGDVLYHQERHPHGEDHQRDAKRSGGEHSSNGTGDAGEDTEKDRQTQRARDLGIVPLTRATVAAILPSDGAVVLGVELVQLGLDLEELAQRVGSRAAVGIESAGRGDGLAAARVPHAVDLAHQRPGDPHADHRRREGDGERAELLGGARPGGDETHAEVAQARHRLVGEAPPGVAEAGLRRLRRARVPRPGEPSENHPLTVPVHHTTWQGSHGPAPPGMRILDTVSGYVAPRSIGAAATGVDEGAAAPAWRTPRRISESAPARATTLTEANGPWHPRTPRSPR